MILPGITRDSVLSIARDHASGKKKIPGLPDQLVVTERPVTMPEVKRSLQEGNLLELFGTGTSQHPEMPFPCTGSFYAHRHGCHHLSSR